MSASRRCPGSACLARWYAEADRRQVHADVVKLIAQTAGEVCQLGADGRQFAGEFGTIIKVDIAKWAKVIKDAGIKAE